VNIKLIGIIILNNIMISL